MHPMRTTNVIAFLPYLASFNGVPSSPQRCFPGIRSTSFPVMCRFRLDAS